ncbi:hypothetical protein JXJ21_14135 [candidate division KSB1 bacterium]|nr:hypothetical protein [candidate division KSB1 bacterium]
MHKFYPQNVYAEAQTTGNMANLPAVHSLRYEREPANLVLEIAGIPLRVRCTRDSLLDSMRNRYHKFMVAAKNACFDIDIHPVPDLQFRNPDGSDNFYNSQEFHDNTCHVQSNYFRGTRDAEKGIPKVTIAETNSLWWLEYFLRVASAIFAVKHSALLFHGAGVIANGKGYVFFGQRQIYRIRIFRAIHLPWR